jgi:putative glutamine amidotransferase
MSSRPVIGIATQTQEPLPGKLNYYWGVGQRYIRVLTSCGGVAPWIIPLLQNDEATLRAIYDRLDGVFLTGGVDVDPAHYGEERHPLCDRSDPPRDWTELTLIRWALADGKPFFGICRGVQVLNVACGGSLYQDVPSQYVGGVKHDCSPTPTGFSRDHLAHPVHIEPGSRLARTLGTEHCQVNSMHHQGIKKLAPGLTATAFAPDGLIEGVEAPGERFVVGVQWHPEELTDRDAVMRRLFTDFVSAAQVATNFRAR